MKVKCIDNGSSPELLINMVYDVIYESESYYTLEQFGMDKMYFKGRFIQIEYDDKNYDYINPAHYKQGDKETWEKMLEIWGKDAFIKHCEITAFKYIQRLGSKPNNSIEQDLEKARWYLNKAYDLKNS